MIKIFYGILLSLLYASTAKAQLPLQVYDLVCDYDHNPIIDNRTPHLSWKISATDTGIKQTAFEIQVQEGNMDFGSDKRPLLWRLKKENDQSIQIPYEGGKMVSGKRYYWRVRVWDNKGRVSPWSQAQYWEMGLLESSDWRAKWITSPFAKKQSAPPVLFRKVFNIKKSVQKARIYITSRGIYESHLNGARIGEDYFTPGWTSYNKRLQYQVYDVTSSVRPGTNVIVAQVADGWLKGRVSGNGSFYGLSEALLAQLQIDYSDGSTEWVVTDDSWKTTQDGSVRLADFYDGEHYDARIDLSKLHDAKFNDSKWGAAKFYADTLDAALVATSAPPVRIQEILKPVKRIHSRAGETIFDFGQNMTGAVRLSIKGNSGDSIVVSHAEVLNADSTFYVDNLRSAKQQIKYVLKGGAREVYMPSLSFFGFRFIKITGSADVVQSVDVEGVVMHSDMKKTGSFKTSHPLINQLQQNIVWGQKGNFVDVPTDCPQRDERWGWTGDAQVFFNTAAYNMNVSNFFRKWLQDLKIDQFASGAIPHIVPYPWHDEQGGAAGWSDAATIIPWNFYQKYGDRSLLSTHFESMERWIGYIEANCEDGLWTKGDHFGDWLFYIPEDDRDGRAAITDKKLIAQAFYIRSLAILEASASVLAKRHDQEKYRHKLENAKRAFVKEFVTPSGRLVSGTQTAYILALEFDILPDSMRAGAAKRLVDNIQSYDFHLTTGFLGTPYICHVLSRFGYDDVAYRLLLQETYPSWLYPVKMGATTIWERWDGIKKDGTFQTPNMNSFNHYAYGAIGEWMYNQIAGIQQKEHSAAYKEIIIAPKPIATFTEAEGKLETMYGKIVSHWKITDNRMTMKIEVPVNTSATVVFPKNIKGSMMYNGKAWDLESKDSNVFDSGKHQFEFMLDR